MSATYFIIALGVAVVIVALLLVAGWWLSFGFGDDNLLN